MDFSISNIAQNFTPATWTIFTILVIMSILSMSVAFNRGFIFFRAKKQSQLFAADVAKALKDVRLDVVLKHAISEEYRFAYLARILKAGIEDAQDVKAKSAGSLDDLSTVAAAMRRTVAEEGAFMRKWMTILATVSSTAPFVGLLGTVFGIINSFVGMAATGSGGLGAVAGGIAEALVMTGVGLIVAIPAVWLYNWANARADGFSLEMGNAASEVLDYIRKNRAQV